MDILNTLRKDPKAKELMKSMPVPQNEEEVLAGYEKVANALGYSITREELLESLKKTEQELRHKTDKIHLNDEALEDVAGGEQGDYHPWSCDESYTEGEWCWFTDSCTVVISFYSDDQPLFVKTEDLDHDETDIRIMHNKL